MTQAKLAKQTLVAQLHGPDILYLLGEVLC